MDERGGAARGRDRLYGSATPRRLGMNGRWTVQRAGSLARGRMKERSKSTQPRRIPVPSRPTRRPKDPKLLRGVRGRGGSKAVLLGCQEVSLVGGRPSSLGGFIGRELWNRTTPRRASALLQGPAVSVNPCFEITRKRKGRRSKRTNSQTRKRSQGIGIVYRHRRGVKSVRHPLVPASDGHPTSSNVASSAPSVDVQLPAPCRQPTSLQVQPCPPPSNAQMSRKVNSNCRLR